MEEGNYKEAISILEKILISNVKLDQARFQLAVVYNLTRQNKLALKELDKIKTNPEIKRMVPLLKGNIFLEEKNWKSSLEIWQKFPQDNADLKSLRAQGMAKSYEGLKKSSKAADAWSVYQSMQLKPANDIFERIAINRVKAGEKDKAISDCSTLISLQKQKDYQEICKAFVYQASGDKKEALLRVQRALEINKENSDAQNLLELFNH